MDSTEGTPAALIEALRRVVREEVQEAIGQLGRAGPAADTAYLSAADAARVAGVRVETIRRWVQSGQLRGVWAGRLLRVERGELHAFLNRPAATSEADDATIVARLLSPSKAA